MTDTPDAGSQEPLPDNSDLEKILSEFFGGLTGQVGVYAKAQEYRREKSRENANQAIFRRVSGKANEDLQVEGFVLDGVNARRWFASLDLSQDIPGEVQKETARLLIAAWAHEAEWANVVIETISIPPHTSMLMSQTSIYVKLSGISKLRASIIAALVANSITHSPSVAVAASVVAAMWDNVANLATTSFLSFG